MSATKVAIVTGANKGLGLAIVKGLCKKYDGIVYLTSRDQERGKQACDELEKLGYKPVFHQLDVSDEASKDRFVNHFRDRKLEVDIIVNNAGVLFLKDATESRVYQAEKTLLVNFFSLVNFTEAMLPFVRNGGKIVNISSSSGHLSRIPSEELRKRFSSDDLTLEELKSLMNSYVEDVMRGEDIARGWGDSPYVVSKVGVNAYTFILHRRYAARGLLVNCMHPGYVMSDMTRGAGTVTPETAARTALKLSLETEGAGLYVWHDGTAVPWDGPDPRRWIDGKDV